MQQLAKIFGSEARVKIMRLFLLNPLKPFDVEAVAQRARISKATARHELAILKSTTFILSHTFKRLPSNKSSNRKLISVSGFILNPSFVYKAQFTHLLTEADFLRPGDIIKVFKGVGRIKLFVISGIFIRESDSRVDLLIVGDNLKRSLIETRIKKLEAEIGKELSYAAFETKEFLYRLSMYDKLVCDIFEFRHETLIDIGDFSDKITPNHLR